MSTETSSSTQSSPLPFTKSLTHLKSFPLISDSLHSITSHPLGQRSISISSTAYEKFLRPFIPYLLKANEIASPYVTKADDYADVGLGKVEEKFPILKEPTENVKSRVTEQFGGAGRLVGGGKEYVVGVYKTELEKENGTKGYLPIAKAGLTATFVITADSIQWLVDQLTSKKAATEANAGEQSEKSGQY